MSTPVSGNDRCPSCGTPIGNIDPTGPTPAGQQPSQTATCPGCGKWLWRRPGGRWELVD